VVLGLDEFGVTEEERKRMERQNREHLNDLDAGAWEVIGSV
jgi:hypothetical protein